METKGKEITEKIKTFKDACLELRIPIQEISINQSVADIGSSVNAFYQLCIIIRALNEGWTPDWKDWSQRKWYNWFYVNSTIVHAGLASSAAYSAIGARLCFKTKKLAEYAAVKFRSTYEDYLLIK